MLIVLPEMETVYGTSSGLAALTAVTVVPFQVATVERPVASAADG